jgi:hypothetical protein
MVVKFKNFLKEEFLNLVFDGTLHGILSTICICFNS